MANIWWKRGIWAALALAGAAAVARAYAPKPTRVEVQPATRGPMAVYVEADGRTRVHDRYILSAPLAGQLARIELHAGDEVKAGAVVARILPAASPLLDPRSRDEARSRLQAARDAHRQALASVERARLAVEFAKKETSTRRDLASREALSRNEVELAELEERTREAELASATFASRVAGHEVETAQSAVARFSRDRDRDADAQAVEATAPVSGRVLRVLQQSAGVVAPGTPLLELGDPAALELVVDVLTADAVQVQPGARVRVARWGGPQELEGRVRLVEPSAFTRTSALGVEEQRVNVIVDLSSPRSAWMALGDGYRVEARIEVWKDESALRAPASALFRQGDAWALFVVEAGKARRKVVQVGRRNGLEAQILGGLAAGEPIIDHPGDSIGEGSSVAP